MATQWDITSGPGITALGLAAARSVETGQPDRLIADPFARKLFSSVDSDLPMLLDWPAAEQSLTEAQKLHLHGSRYIGLRTRFYDDALLAAANAGVRQAALLGAGLDTRAFRLELPADLQLCELDQPGVLAYKDDVLRRERAEARCARTEVRTDLRDDWAATLRDSGFRPDRATAWIAEGLLPYLNTEAQVELIQHVIALAAPGSSLAFDNIVGDPRGDGRLRTLSERSGMDMQTLMAAGETADLSKPLTKQGWKAVQRSTLTLARRYSRDLSDPFTEDETARPVEPPWLDTIFVSAMLPI